MRTMGIEEEYLLIGAGGRPVAVAGAAIKAFATSSADAGETGGDVGAELTQQQLESGTRPRADLGELLEEVREGRRLAQQAAAATGARIAALGTSPVPVEPTTSADARYEEMTRRFALTAREQLTCGCHVHVEIADDDEGVAVLDRISPWLPLLLALSTNSPFWQGSDSGYASYRSQVWNRWPTAGPVAPFGSAAAYHALVDDLVATGTILDRGMIYFDARLSSRYPTLEVRVADVCLDVRDAVLVAALVRGLVDTAAAQAADGLPPAPVRVEQLRAASWLAGRSGLTGELLSARTLRPVPSRQAVTELVGHVSGALDRAGDLGWVRGRVDALLTGRTGTQRQRDWYADGGLTRVAEAAVHATSA